VQGVISTDSYHLDLLHLRTATGTQILDLRRDMYNLPSACRHRGPRPGGASRIELASASCRIQDGRAVRSPGHECGGSAARRATGPLQGYKGGEIEAVLNGQSQMRAAFGDADKLLEASQHPWLRDAPKRVHVVRASPATMLHGRLYRLQRVS
jgi:hypothetical protein